MEKIELPKVPLFREGTMTHAAYALIKRTDGQNFSAYQIQLALVQKRYPKLSTNDLHDSVWHAIKRMMKHGYLIETGIGIDQRKTFKINKRKLQS